MVGEHKMIYLWTIPDKYRNRDIGEYDRDISPDRFFLKEGRILGLNEFKPKPTVNFEVKKERVLQFDCLPNDALVPLVNERVKNILESIAIDDIQFFPAKLVCTDGILESYYFLNATHLIKGIDHEKSIYTTMDMLDGGILGFSYLTYKEGCLEKHQLARDEEYESNLLVSEGVKSIFDKEKISGVRLVRPEDYYRPVSELI